MAYVYIGDKSKVDAEVLEAVKSLPDEFYVFAEFAVGQRNIDWLVCRAAQAGSFANARSTVIVGELKRLSRPLRGQTNGIWQIQDGQGAWQDIITSNDSDTNYYYQAVNAANAVKSWLYNNQRLFLSAAEPRDENVFRVWPDLILLSGNALAHQLPIAPDNRFGAWFTSLPKWIDHIQSWNPTVGLAYSAADLQALGNALGLTRIWPLASATKRSEITDPGLDPLISYFTALHQRLAALEDRIGQLEAR